MHDLSINICKTGKRTMDARIIIRIITRIIIIYSLTLSTVTIAISTPSSLVVIPHGSISERGTLEYGIRTMIFSDSQDTLKTKSTAFYHLSLTDKFQLGLNTSQEIDVLLNMKGKIAYAELLSSKHSIVLGLQNLGLSERYWKDDEWKTLQETSLPRVRSYAVYTIEIPKLRSFYHVGLADYHSFNHDYVIAGAHYEFRQFRTSAEWDGKQVHFSLLFKLPHNIQLYGALTPIPDKKDNLDKHFISVALTYKSKIFKEKNQKELDAIKKDYESIKNKLAVIDAKIDVIREFSSLDFLEEFQQFLLQEHMVEDELDNEKKTTIRLALEHMQRGLEFYYKQEYQLSLKEYNIVTTLVPTFSIAYARLGSIYYKLGDLKKAQESWTQALELDPSNDNLKLFLKRITPPEALENGEETKKNIDISDEYQLLKIIPENDQI
tara:strand:- start:2607 stop:3914 length:1308 start_codon:yes stop_codon:yes gene_type:complete